MGGGRIFYYDEKKNWWSRAGIPANMPLGEPGGPDSEMFWDFGEELKIHENSSFKDLPCHVNCDCGRFVEIGNNVFMQYVKTKNGFELLPKGNIDFGGGLERILAASQDSSDIFLTDIFSLVIKKLEEISGKKYAESEQIKRSFRIISDHIKGATFLISDGVVPSNTERGYFLRRLIRRAIRFGKVIGIENNFISKIAEIVIQTYGEAYPNLVEKQESIFGELMMEEEKFRKTLEKGIREFEKVTSVMAQSDCEEEYMDVCGLKTRISGKISAKIVFDLYTTYGFPIEMIKEIATEKKFQIDEEGFKEEMKKHQELSRTASSGMFKGGLQDSGEESAKLHTATHLLLAALRQVLGNNVFQKGSNITPERLRLDFSHTEKMTKHQIEEVEKIVNAAIASKLDVVREEMTLEEAKKQEAMGVFESKYGNNVSVYSIVDDKHRVVSREICGGPHTKNTGNMGLFRIQKEEASSAGVRRIKAVLE
jgi:alanyl-tRNA synthetase